jgi:predicted hotdog family 3-hydroxylacyl-ACP dehydratase
MLGVVIDPARALPHGPRARLLNRVLEASGDTVRALGRIGAATPGASAGEAPAILGLELGAQCAAMFGAAMFGAGEGGAPRIGFLVSIRSARLHRPFLPVDRDLEVEARRVGGAAGLELFEVAVRVPGEVSPAVEGVLGTMLTDRRVAPEGGDAV